MRLALLTLVALAAGRAAAGEPNDYVHMPIVEEGESEIEWKAGHQRLPQHDGSASAEAIGLGTSPVAGWFTEIYAKYAKTPGQGTAFDAVEWENLFQLTQTGRWPVDVGVLLEVEHPANHAEGIQVTAGPLLQYVSGRLQSNLNVLLQQNHGATEDLPSELHVQAQLRWYGDGRCDVGAQLFGETRQWNHPGPLSHQTLTLGPGLFGKLHLGQRQTLQWNAALLGGVGAASPPVTVRMQAELEF